MSSSLSFSPDNSSVMLMEVRALGAVQGAVQSLLRPVHFVSLERWGQQVNDQGTTRHLTFHPRIQFKTQCSECAEVQLRSLPVIFSQPEILETQKTENYQYVLCKTAFQLFLLFYFLFNCGLFIGPIFKYSLM